MKKEPPILADIRRQYGNLTLKVATTNPILFFNQWFEEIVLVEKNDPTAMVVSTVDEAGHPDSRVVLLKGIEEESFIFFTNYESNKALQINHTPYVALNFYWPVMSRQVRIRGPVQRVSTHQSDTYFASRPKLSQIGAIASEQSKPLNNRQEFEIKIAQLIEKYHEKPIPRPDNWGGYAVRAMEIEFWQGKDNRLHERLHYLKKNNNWFYQHLFP